MSPKRRRKSVSLVQGYWKLAEKDEGTPETRAKLRPNPLAELSQARQDAAERLRDAWLIVSGPAQRAMATFERIQGAKGVMRDDSEVGGAKDMALTATVRHYRSWVDEMARLRLPTRPVIAIVAEDKIPEEVLIPQLGLVYANQIMRILEQALDLFD